MMMLPLKLEELKSLVSMLVRSHNKKWQSPIGTASTTKTPFIVIKNQDRRDLSKSVPNPDLKGHHNKTEKELAAELKKSDDAKMYDTYSK